MTLLLWLQLDQLFFSLPFLPVSVMKGTKVTTLDACILFCTHTHTHYRYYSLYMSIISMHIHTQCHISAHTYMYMYTYKTTTVTFAIWCTCVVNMHNLPWYIHVYIRMCIYVCIYIHMCMYMYAQTCIKACLHWSLLYALQAQCYKLLVRSYCGYGMENVWGQ